MDIEYYKKLQNAHGTKNKREKELVKVNRNSNKHFDDTFDTEDVLVNNKPMQLMIVHDTDLNVHKKKIKRVLQSHIADVPCHPSQGRDR